MKSSKNKLDSHLVGFLKPGSIEAEHYRRLRHSVEVMASENSGVVVALTSALPGEGKTLTSVNLAGTLAQNPEARVLLVDMDLRQTRSSVGSYLGFDSGKTPGITGYVTNQDLEIGDVTQALPDYNLDVLFAGKRSEKPYEVVVSHRIGELLSEARAVYDFVVVDTPPIVLLPDCQVISKWLDGILVVVAADITQQKMLGDAFGMLDPDKVKGIVLNGHTAIKESYYHSYFKG